MPIAEHVICGWPNTVASIPSGWARVAAMDEKYVRAIPDNETDPGDTGGSPDHDHTTPGHIHPLNHDHAATNSAFSNMANGTGDEEDLPQQAFAHEVHRHTTTLPSATVSSGSASPGTDSIDNELDRLEVIWIESNGTPEEFPAGALLFCTETDVPEGYILYTDGDGLFLRGAVNSGDGGAEEEGTLGAHVHTVEAHTHAGASHDHPNASSSGASAVFQGPAGPGSPPNYTRGHSHTVTSSSVSTGDLGSAGGGVSGAATPEPPYVDILIIESEGIVPKNGAIALWIEELSEIPEGWVLCDGENGTQNLCQGRFVRGTQDPENILDIGGAETHVHTGPSSHSHSIGSHNHALTYNNATGQGNSGADGGDGVQPNHGSQHNHNSASASNFVGNASAGALSSESHVPQYIEVAYIMYIAETPPVVNSGFWLFF